MIDTELTAPRSQRTPAVHAIPALELLVDILSGASSEMDRSGFYSHLAEAV